MPAITYVALHAGLGAVKVGSTSTTSNRRRLLERRGWEVRYCLLVEADPHARSIERAALFELRHRLHIPAFLTASQMPGGGWSETAALGLITAEGLWGIVCEQAGLIHMNPGGDRGRWLRQPPVYRRTKGDTPKYSKIARNQTAITTKTAVNREGETA